MSAAAYEHKFSKKVVLAFVGSDQIVDWIAANKNVLRRRGKHFRGLQLVATGALEIAGKVNLLRRRDGSKIAMRDVHVVGHSLGGYLAQLIVAVQPVDGGVSFNGPGLLRLVPPAKRDEISILLGDQAAQYRHRYPQARMHNHVKQLDPIGRFGRHFGLVHLYRGPARKAHSIERFRNELINEGLAPYMTVEPRT